MIMGFKADPYMFPSICLHYSCFPDLSRVLAFQRWITPEFEKWRYDTYFYCVVLSQDDLSVQTANVDGQEITQVDWFTPTKALEQGSEGSILLSPPTFQILKDLLAFPDLDTLAKNLSVEREMKPQKPVILIDGNEKIVALLGDEHNGGPPGVKNRIVSNCSPTGRQGWHVVREPHEAKL
eukprot:TRINITY_DN6113_c0_g1_i3.p1 TRINITY_DN6113_c0_g1~~TRINITY_DN6113_c0_g1_i3.p1  ORF type:complete len:180 (+),score=32.61 TRINITY_DN6113_c0_g1_i3:58-597(+)